MHSPHGYIIPKNKFLVLPRVGIFPIQYKVVLKIAPPKISRFTPCDISATPSHFFESFQNSFFHFILSFDIMHIPKRREHGFPVFFSVSFSVALYIRQAPISLQTVNDTERKIKLETIFLAFQNVLI